MVWDDELAVLEVLEVLEDEPLPLLFPLPLLEDEDKDLVELSEEEEEEPLEDVEPVEGVELVADFELSDFERFHQLVLPPSAPFAFVFFPLPVKRPTEAQKPVRTFGSTPTCRPSPLRLTFSSPTRFPLNQS